MIDTKLGDIWELGKQRLLCGDATKLEDVQRLMGDDKAHMIFTDPPWNVNYKGHTKERQKIANDNLKSNEFIQLIEDAFSAAARFSLPGCMTYVVMATASFADFMPAMKRAGFRWSDILIWLKDTFVVSWSDYHKQYEPIWYGWRNAPRRLHPLTDRTQSSVWKIKRPKINTIHPTMKPVELAEKAINNSSNEGDVVLDMFAGSGSTLIAAENTGRCCRAMEIEPSYCNVIVQRYIDAFGLNDVKKL